MSLILLSLLLTLLWYELDRGGGNAGKEGGADGGRSEWEEPSRFIGLPAELPLAFVEDVLLPDGRLTGDSAVVSRLLRSVLGRAVVELVRAG